MLIVRQRYRDRMGEQQFEQRCALVAGEKES